MLHYTMVQTAQTTTLVTGVKIAEIGGTTDETTGDGTTVTAETMTEMDGVTLHPHLEVTQTETGTVVSMTGTGIGTVGQQTVPPNMTPRLPLLRNEISNRPLQVCPHRFPCHP